MATKITHKKVTDVQCNERPPFPQFVAIKDLTTFDDARTITVVAESVEIYKDGNKPKTFKMEAGRMAAQVGHVVSKLKLGYLIWSVQVGAGEAYERTYELAQDLFNISITNVVLKARDSKELNHILDLCSSKSLHTSEFYDDNPCVYGKGIRVLTAICIGPVRPEQVFGITDYLPLWKEPTDSVG